MSNQVLKTFADPGGTRRVDVYQRPNGTYGFEELRYATEDQCWLPFGRYSHAVIDTLERAEKEARSRVSWLSELPEDLGPT